MVAKWKSFFGNNKKSIFCDQWLDHESALDNFDGDIFLTLLFSDFSPKFVLKAPQSPLYQCTSPFPQMINENETQIDAILSECSEECAAVDCKTQNPKFAYKITPYLFAVDNSLELYKTEDTWYLQIEENCLAAFIHRFKARFVSNYVDKYVIRCEEEGKTTTDKAVIKHAADVSWLRFVEKIEVYLVQSMFLASINYSWKNISAPASARGAIKNIRALVKNEAENLQSHIWTTIGPMISKTSSSSSTSSPSPLHEGLRWEKTNSPDRYRFELG